MVRSTDDEAWEQMTRWVGARVEVTGERGDQARFTELAASYRAWLEAEGETAVPIRPGRRSRQLVRAVRSAGGRVEWGLRRVVGVRVLDR
jgi:hypothetical protein